MEGCSGAFVARPDVRPNRTDGIVSPLALVSACPRGMESRLLLSYHNHHLHYMADKVLNNGWCALESPVRLQSPLKSEFASSTPKIAALQTRAEMELWDGLPLYAIAEAHRKRADDLLMQHANFEEVYVGYSKFLLLYEREDAQRAHVLLVVGYLAEALAQGFTSASETLI
ncbi:hypothetical protein MKEN_01474800 [Mycena kentingensis (nom. inval.)]|nr:hypothetical protein MKEN_01474800 [Mycena kentingensis (nom. inval.)]